MGGAVCVVKPGDGFMLFSKNYDYLLFYIKDYVCLYPQRVAKMRLLVALASFHFSNDFFFFKGTLAVNKQQKIKLKLNLNQLLKVAQLSRNMCIDLLKS